MKEKKDKVDIYILNLFTVFVIFCMNLLFNQWICEGNRVFYLDDLSCIDSYMTNSVWNFIFSRSANKMRPVFGVVTWLCIRATEHNYELLDEILLLFNFINSMLIYVFVYKIQHEIKSIYRIISSCICAIMFIASRFAYYNISELLGIMEGMGIALAIIMLMLLYLFLEDEKNSYYYGALVMYTLLIWTHERYFVLFLLFPLVLYFQKDLTWLNRSKKMMLPIAVLISFWIIRMILFGSRMIDGTGGTSVSDTFSMKTAITFCFSQVGYILGFNCGPQYLNGIEFDEVPKEINVLLIFNLLIVLSVCVSYIRLLIKNKAFRSKNLKKVVLFVVFIGLCIICSSITIRVEMRWIYVSYAAYLILLFYMLYSWILHNDLVIRKIILFSFFTISVLITEQFYRNHYDNIYYWTQKDMSRAIYDATVEKYEADLVSMDIIIVGNYWKDQEWQYDEWKLFFAPYINSDGINVIYAENIYIADDCLGKSDNGIVLLEDLENKVYIDITNKMKLLGTEYLYGIYEDCWCDMTCAFEVHGDMYHKATLRLYYPEDLEVRGMPNGTICINDETEIDYTLTDNLTTIELDLPAQSINTIQINANYWVHENTGRSEDGRLSNTLYIDIS